MAKETFDCPVASVVMVDGDTQDIVLDRGWKVAQGVTTRIAGVDAPEIRTAAGKLVSQLVERWLNIIVSTAYRLRWLSRELDMYGRSLGDYVDRQTGDTLSKYLLDNGLAKVFDGKKAREPWTDVELKTIEDKANALLAAK